MTTLFAFTPLRFPRTLLTLAVAAAALAACNTLPATNAQLEDARGDYRNAQLNPQASTLAAEELRVAGDALNKADEAWTRRDDSAQVNHLAYLAKQRVAIAQATMEQKTAERAIVQADSARDKLRLQSRTEEANAAQRSAVASQRQSEASQRQAQAAQQQAALSQSQADSAQRQADASLQQAGEAQARSVQLEAQIKDLNAQQTKRGLVVTLGDVLFDTNHAELKSGALRSVDKLAVFLKQYPQRKALIEGFTDSTGSESHNQALSSQRADAVRTAMLAQGVDSGRVSTRGYGEAFPVATNDSAGGRQLNRRVEIVLSDDSGAITPR